MLMQCIMQTTVLAIMMGINKANSTYACVWCTVAKDERCTLTYSYRCIYITCIVVRMGYKCTRESVGSLLQTMKEIRPTIFLRVPRSVCLS